MTLELIHEAIASGGDGWYMLKRGGTGAMVMPLVATYPILACRCYRTVRKEAVWHFTEGDVTPETIRRKSNPRR